MSQITTTDDMVNYEIWVGDKIAKVYPDLPDYCWEVAQRLRRHYNAAGVIRCIRLDRVTRHNVPFCGGVRQQVKERRTLMFSCGRNIYKDINS